MVMKVFIFLTVLVIGGLLFYWFEYRPSDIRSICTEYAMKNAQEVYILKNPSEKGKASSAGMYLKDDMKDSYITCLNRNGLAS
jgi:hypothetical protein